MSEPTSEHKDALLFEPLNVSNGTTRTIVVGYDGSQSARDALGVAVDLARCSPGTRVMVACGQDKPAPWFGYTYRGPIIEQQAYLDELTEVATRQLEEAAEAVREAGVEVSVACTRDAPVDTLLTIAKDTGATMIVIGAKGSGALHDTVMGSTTMKLLHKTTIPVVIVPARH
jgi:nucleotide-binding universal stress UspA family protein